MARAAATTRGSSSTTRTTVFLRYLKKNFRSEPPPRPIIERLARLGMEQQERHHAARVLELDAYGSARRIALWIASPPDMQRAHAARIVDCYRCFLLADASSSAQRPRAVMGQTASTTPARTQIYQS